MRPSLCTTLILGVTGCVDSMPDLSDEPAIPFPEERRSLGKVEAGDMFGASMASGDFNHDGFMDLAVGASGEGVSGVGGEGAVFVYKGTSSGLVPWKLLTENDFGVAVHVADGFGSSLATRDMNGDGFDELVVGAPGYTINGHVNAGAVFPYFGTSTGLVHGASMVTETTAGGSPEENDFFGWSIALGSYDGTDQMVAVGAPFESVPGKPTGTGWVATFYWAGDSLIVPAQNLAPNQSTSNAEFGIALQTVNNGGAADDLVIGAATDNNQGRAYLYKHASSGLVQKQAIVTPDGHDGFGHALAAGKFRNSHQELAVATTFDGASNYGGRIFVYNYNATSFYQLEQTLDFKVNGVDAPASLGSAMTTGDFDGDGFDELVAGAPTRVSGVTEGAVVVYQSHAGAPLTTWGTRTLHGDVGDLGIDGRYGSSVAVGDFNRTTPHRIDMVIGAPTITVGFANEAGLIQEYFGDGTIPNWTATITEATP